MECPDGDFLFQPAVFKSGKSAMTSMLKVIEVIAESDKSWEDAAANAVARAGKTLNGIRSIYIKDQQAKVENNKIVLYRINANISFLLE
jgi:dodecin